MLGILKIHMYLVVSSLSVYGAKTVTLHDIAFISVSSLAFKEAFQRTKARLDQFSYAKVIKV
jgi:hypothetical protein